jgi:hypothetical protein
VRRTWLLVPRLLDSWLSHPDSFISALVVLVAQSRIVLLVVVRFIVRSVLLRIAGKAVIIFKYIFWGELDGSRSSAKHWMGTAAGAT